ncbi:MAG: MBL fold metallo-hydrolase [Pseudohongiella sp.]|nr:MBL fold metallo-hydrolase [Pseudohongiella sp.]MDO9518653.1 MBL fold metallo-hydrolase [Pseudohongiella sp.]MDP2128426.1 MBL fold metallo-hydrolase [Pseudohongiella sp.]
MENSRFIAGQPVDVSTGSIRVQRLLCPNASVMTGPGTNTYLIGERELALIDPGPAIPAHNSAIIEALAGWPLKWIFVTHTHGDHSPGTAALKALTGAQVVGLSPPEGAAYQDHGFVPDRVYRDGESIQCDGFSMRLVHTPGHVSNHLCFLLEEDAILFTGDHILQGTTPVILPPDGDMTDYMNSLEQLRQMPLKALAPGHGEVMTEPVQMIDTLIRHRQRREQKVVKSLGALNSCTLNELVLLAYDDVPAHLIPWAKKTLLAHLYKLQRDGRARSDGAENIEECLWEIM